MIGKEEIEPILKERQEATALVTWSEGASDEMSDLENQGCALDIPRFRALKALS